MTGGIAAIEARIRSIEARFPTPRPGFDRALADASVDGVADRAAASNGGGQVGGLSFPSVPAASILGPAFAQPAIPAPEVAPPSTVAGDAPAWASDLPAAAGPWTGAIVDAAERHDVDPRLLAAMVWQESRFDPDAVSHAGARGLTQLMPGTAADLGVDPNDPLQNLDGGARYLREQLDRFGRTDLALAAYNAGPGRVSAAGGIPAITETRDYVTKVTGYLTRLGG